MPEMASWLISNSYGSWDKSTLTIDTGRTILEEDEFTLGTFSPIIRTYPNTRRFVLLWNNSLLGITYCHEVIYDRAAGIFTDRDGCGEDASSKVLGRGLADRDIHQGAATDESYISWADKHWKR